MAVESSTDNSAVPIEVQAAKILDNYCFRCHRGEGSSSGRYAFNVRNVESMQGEDILNAKNSDLLSAMSDGRMPPRNQASLPRPSRNEVEIVRQWIEEGAKDFPPPVRRPFLSIASVLEKIAAHNLALQPPVREMTRYFILTNLHNDPSADDRHLRMTRAALAKTLNSLSWESAIVLPQPIDQERTIYAVEISKLGWTREHWSALVENYPYTVDAELIGVNPSGDATSRLRKLESDMIRQNNGDRMTRFLRADWMITIGLRPTLYHKLLYELKLPNLIARPSSPSSPNNPKSMTDRDLEDFLGITNIQENIFGPKAIAKRTGFNESGISGQNRMIERHELRESGGYYWKSYDFLESNSRSILSSFPLGPFRKSSNVSDNDFAFIHDGGEIIFSLPNRLQGYLLSTGAGERLDAGPIEIVGDALKTSGNQLIVNGLSCVVCHRRGMVEPPDDQVRGAALAYGEIADRVRQLYPEPSEMQALVESDSKQFTSVAYPMMKSYLLDGEDKPDLPSKEQSLSEQERIQNKIDSLPEPVGEVARKYLLEPMNIDTVASELFIEDIATIRVLAKRDPRVRLIGLGQLKEENGTIKREAWQNVQGRSLMQAAADVFGYGE
jgi:hypothetical protein